MAKFRFSGPLATPLRLLIPTYTTEYGVAKPTYPAPDDAPLIYGTFRTFGGTDREVNGAYAVENTATIETWYRSDIKADCRIYVPATGATYQIIGSPENIEMRCQYLSIRVMEIKGGAGA